jgi:hypothetical protein
LPRTGSAGHAGAGGRVAGVYRGAKVGVCDLRPAMMCAACGGDASHPSTGRASTVLHRCMRIHMPLVTGSPERFTQRGSDVMRCNRSNAHLCRCHTLAVV